MFEIKNKDEKCFARAVAVAIAAERRNDSGEARNYYENNIRRNRTTKDFQREDADVLMKNAGLEEHQGPCGPEEWRKLESSLDVRYGIRIWSKDYCRGILYEGRSAPEHLHLFLYDNHFAVITKLTGYLNRSYVCHDCLRGFNNKHEHNCTKTCRYCFQNTRCVSNEKRLYCSKCNNWFTSEQCFDNHKRNFIEVNKGKKRKKTTMMSACCLRKRCTKCHHIKGIAHVCFKFKCSVCKLIVVNEKDHQKNCYMQTLDGDKKKKENSSEEKFIGEGFQNSFVFFDFESHQTRELTKDKNGNSMFAHDPNYCIVQKVCDICKDDNEIWYVYLENFFIVSIFRNL